jgi:hypothetical protein
MVTRVTMPEGHGTPHTDACTAQELHPGRWSLGLRWRRLRLRDTSVARRGSAFVPDADSDGSDEAVAATRQRFDEPWTVGGIAERGPQLRDGDVEAPLEVDEGLLAPQPSTQFVTRHELARTLDECRQQLKGVVLKPDLGALFREFASSEIGPEHSKVDDVGGVLDFPH